MTIPTEIFNDCDCCSYGFEVFQNPRSTVWYLNGGFPTRFLRISRADGVALSSVTGFAGGFTMDPDLNVYNRPTSPTRIQKYDVDGNLLWTYTEPDSSFVAPAANTDLGKPIYVDGDRAVYYAGSITGGSPDFVDRKAKLVKVAPNGTLEWEVIKSVDTTEALAFIGPCVNPDGDVFVSGSRGLVSGGHSGEYDFCFDKDGNELWSNVSTNMTGTRNIGQNNNFGAGGDVLSITSTSVGSGSTRFRNYDDTGTIAFTLDNSDFPGVLSSTRLYFEYYQGALYAVYGASPNVVRVAKRSGASLGTLDWQIDITPSFGTLQNYTIGVDVNGDPYIAYNTFSSPDVFIGYYTRRNSSDGSEIFADSVTGNVSHPHLPPGRPPIFTP